MEAAEAQHALGRRLYEIGVDDGELGRQIADVEDELRRSSGIGAHAEWLHLKRRRLFIRLAAAAMEDDAPLPGAEAEHREARQAMAALYGSGEQEDDQEPESDGEAA